MNTLGHRAGLRRADVGGGASRRRPPTAALPRDGPPPPKKQQPAVAQTPAVPSRLSRLFQNYKTEDLEAQQIEAEEYAATRAAATANVKSSRDGRPASRAARAQQFATGNGERSGKYAKMFKYDDATHKDEPIIGVYGKGKPQWWALRVNPGREKQVAEAIERMLKQMPPVVGSRAPRAAEHWIPLKRVRAWSPKTNKMGTKLVKYEEGGWLLVETVMDKPFALMLGGNYNFL